MISCRATFEFLECVEADHVKEGHTGIHRTAPICEGNLSGGNPLLAMSSSVFLRVPILETLRFRSALKKMLSNLHDHLKDPKT